MGAGDFDVDNSQILNHGKKGMIDVDGEFSIGNLGNGLWNSGTGCQGCSGDNVKLDKSKIKDTVKKNQDPNDPNNNRRYNTWDGVGCGGCRLAHWLLQMAISLTEGYPPPTHTPPSGTAR
jgi:hypothetical protein